MTTRPPSIHHPHFTHHRSSAVPPPAFVIRHSSFVIRHSAFTLVEMLLVLVILATLAAIVIPKMAGRSQQAKIAAAQTQIEAFKTSLDSFEVDNSYYPKSGNLNDLVEQPAGATNWKGPYLDRIPNDPWGKPYTYEYPGKHSNVRYDLSSFGPDGSPGNDDDITNWNANK